MMLGMNNKMINAGLVLLVLAMFPLSAAQAAEVQGKAPDFTLKSSSGKNLKLSEHRGEVVLLNFWASWCGPCRKEMPYLEQIQEKYADYGFTVLGVNVEEDSSKANKMLKDIPVSFPILYDTTNSVSKAYKVSAMPTTVIIDRDGNMRYLHKGYKSGDEATYKQWVKKLIRE
jgi:thiol-disulfide isomerase/thioredoxin